MKKELGFAAEVTGYSVTALFAVCALLAAADLWADEVWERTHFYENIYHTLLAEQPPARMLTDKALMGRLAVFSTIAGLGFTLARFGKGLRKS